MEYEVTEPVLFSKDLGQPLTIKPHTFPETNSDDQPIIPLTTEQKYIFDARGWLVIPSVLNSSDLEEMRLFCQRLQQDPESIPAKKESIELCLEVIGTYATLLRCAALATIGILSYISLVYHISLLLII